MASRGIAVALAALAIVVAGRAVSSADPTASPSPAVSAPHDFVADIAAAKELQRKGRAREAIALLAADYKVDPTNRDVAVAFAQTYSYSGDQGRAIDVLDKLLAGNPDDLDARIVLAQAYAFNHDYAAAQAQYQKVLAAAPADSDAQVGLAQTYTFEGRFAEAKTLYKSVLARDSKNYDALVGLAGAEGFSGDYRAARSDYQTVLNAQPDNSDALVGLATVEYWMNNLPSAIALDNRALNLDPGDSDARDLKKQLTIKTSPQLISTMTTSHSSDGATFDYRLSERFFASPTTSFGLVQEVYRIDDPNTTTVQTHRFGFVATYQQSSRFGVDLSLLGSKYSGVPSATDSVLSIYGANNGLGYGLGISNGGVDGSVRANGGQINSSQESALVRITALFGNASYTRRGTSVNFGAQAAAYNDGNRFHDFSADVSHEIGIGASTTVTPAFGIRSSGFSNTYNTPAQAISPGYYNYQSERDVNLSTIVNRQLSERFSVGAIGVLGVRRTTILTYPLCYPPQPCPPPLAVTPGDLPYQRFEPFFDYEGDRFSLAGALYEDHYRGSGPVLPYESSTIDLTFSIRLP